MIKNQFLSGAVFFLLFTVIGAPKVCLAIDLNKCMVEKMQQANDSITIGELRLECQKQIHDGTYAAQEQETSIATERVRQDKAHVLQPFTLMSHKPNYILLGAHNTHGYDSEIFQTASNDQSLEADDTEAQFQLSVKFPLAVSLFSMADVYAAYTNRSFWQVYNDNSAPFRETNHEPEGWVQFNPQWELWGFKNTANMFGIVHQSNGRGGTLSRSWNRIYANFIVERGNLALSFKPWYRIQEDEDDDDNRDITDYLGHAEIRAAYKYKEHVFSIMSRNNVESGFENGAVELSWSFPLFGYPYLKGYVQYFTGYGESLIDYDNYVNRIGVGFAVTDWL
ncbi:MAG: phospholipase A [Desulforhopalus sp.]